MNNEIVTNVARVQTVADDSMNDLYSEIEKAAQANDDLLSLYFCRYGAFNDGVNENFLASGTRALIVDDYLKNIVKMVKSLPREIAEALVKDEADDEEEES
jgi:hypothetical protein